MLTKESRTYKLAKAALLAVLLAVTPVTGMLQAQTRPLPGAQKQEEDPLSVLYKAAVKSFEEKKYKEALAQFEELEGKAVDVELKLKAVLSFQKSLCYFFIKDWPRAQTELTGFLDKYPKGTEDFLSESDNRRGTADLLLIEVLSKQGKWELALARLEKIRTNTLARPEERVNAFTLSAQIIVDRAKSSPEDVKKAASTSSTTAAKVDAKVAAKTAVAAAKNAKADTKAVKAATSPAAAAKGALKAGASPAVAAGWALSAYPVAPAPAKPAAKVVARPAPSASKPRIGSLAVPLPVGGQTTGTDAKAMRGTWPVSRQRCSRVAARTADSRPSVCGFSR